MATAARAVVSARPLRPLLSSRRLPSFPSVRPLRQRGGVGSVRCMARRPDSSYSPLRSGQGGDRAPTEMAPLFPGCDYEHWLIVMDKPGGEGATKQQMIDCYIQTLAQVVGSEEEAKKRIYNVSCERYFGFGCEIDEETSNKLEGLPGVLFVLPDSYVDAENKDYGEQRSLSLTVFSKTFSENRHLDMKKGQSRNSLKTFSSSGHSGVKQNYDDLVNDKLLIDCGEDQDCVLGGIVALGKFDALHIGHRELAMHASKAGTPFLLSFVGMAEVLGWTYRPPIVAQCDRKRVLSSWAPYCRNVVPLEYQVEFSKVRSLSPRQFVERLSKDLRIKGVVAGENYRFGYKASGDAVELVKLCEEFGLSAFIVRSVMDTAKRSHNGLASTINSSDKGQVSSSRVRHALAIGDMEYVSELLGRKHRLVLMVNQKCLHETKRIVLPNSCMLNMPPAEGLYENCNLVNGGYIGPCRVIINSDTIVIEMKDENSLSPNPIQEVRQLGIEFG